MRLLNQALLGRQGKKNFILMAKNTTKLAFSKTEM